MLELSRFRVGGFEDALDWIFLEAKAASSFLASGFSLVSDNLADWGIVTALLGLAFIAEVIGACGAAGVGGLWLMRL